MSVFKFNFKLVKAPCFYFFCKGVCTFKNCKFSHNYIETPSIPKNKGIYCLYCLNLFTTKFVDDDLNRIKIKKITNYYLSEQKHKNLNGLISCLICCNYCYNIIGRYIYKSENNNEFFEIFKYDKTKRNVLIVY